MNTYVIQLLLHFQNTETNDKRFEEFLTEVRDLAEKHGITLDDYQSFCLSGEEYKIAPCTQCGHLTVNREDIRENIESMLPDFWFYVRRGKVSDNKSICELCENKKN